MARQRANAGSWVGAAAIVGVLVAAAWWGSSGETAPPMSVGVAPAKPVAVEATAAGGAEPVRERDPAVLPETKVVGTVRDHEGRPLVGVPVTLQRDGSLLDGPFGLTNSTATDEHGEFAFAQQPPALYVVATTVDGGPSQQVALASGETKRCDLQFAVSPVRLWGELRRAGQPAPHQRVAITGSHRTGVVKLERGANLKGLFHCFLPPGSYTVAVLEWVSESPKWVAESPKTNKEVAVAARSIVLADGAREVRCDFTVPRTRLHVQVDAGAHAAIAALEVHVVGTDAMAAPFAAARQPGDDLTTTFDGLPAGTWRVFATAPGIVETGHQIVELSAGSPEASVALRSQPSGTVRVSLRGADGRPCVVLPGTLPVVVAGGRELPCTVLPRGRDGLDRGAYVCCSVPPGRAELQFADRLIDGRRSFLAFDPQPAHAFDVVPGERNAVDLLVQPRALVQLRALERYGREDPFARLTLFVGEVEVVSHERKPQAQRWLGYLPPGEYRVVVERRIGRAERQITVAQEDLKLDLRP